MKFCKRKKTTIKCSSPYSFEKFDWNAIESSQRPQVFPFKATLMNYLMSNMSANLTQKSYLCCKYFFFKSQKPICHFLHLCDGRRNIRFVKQFMAVNNPNSKYLENLWISNSIHVDTINSSFLSKIIPKMGKITPSFLTLRNQKLSINDYFLLTKSPKIHVVRMDNVSIEDDGVPIAFEDFFAPLSRALIIE